MKLKITLVIIAMFFLAGIYYAIPVIVDLYNEELAKNDATIPQRPEFTEGATEWSETPNPPSVIGSEGGSILPETVAEDIVRRAIPHIAKYDFNAASDVIVNGLASYDIDQSPAYFKYLEYMRGDLAVLAQLELLSEYQEFEAMKDAVRNLYDPLTLTVGVLYLSAMDRQALIEDRNSLNPLFGSIDSIGEVTIKREALPGYTYLNTHYAIPLTLDGYNVEASVVEVDGAIHLYGFYGDETARNQYMTIEEYNTSMAEYENLLNPSQSETEQHVDDSNELPSMGAEEDLNEENN